MLRGTVPEGAAGQPNIGKPSPPRLGANPAVKVGKPGKILLTQEKDIMDTRNAAFAAADALDLAAAAGLGGLETPIAADHIRRVFDDPIAKMLVNAAPFDGPAHPALAKSNTIPKGEH